MASGLGLDDSSTWLAKLACLSMTVLQFLASWPYTSTNVPHVSGQAGLGADAGSRRVPFLGLDSRGQNLSLSRGEAKGHIAPRKPLYIVRDPRPHHRHTPPEGGGCWQCARESRRYKRGFLQKPARQPPLGSGGWVPGGLADTQSPKALCGGQAPGGELLASPRDLVSGQAAPEVAKAPQGAPRGGGSPSRPSPRVESVARRLMRAVGVCGVGCLQHP